jgi:hypothetical protein
MKNSYVIAKEWMDKYEALCNNPRIYTPKIPTTKNFSQNFHVMMSVMYGNPT